MIRKRGRGICPSCTFRSKDAHLYALHDYESLFQSTITNKQMRNFLKLESESTTHKILVSMQLPRKGTTKGRTYELTDLII
jgi:hypothetical protein